MIQLIIATYSFEAVEQQDDICFCQRQIGTGDVDSRIVYISMTLEAMRMKIAEKGLVS